MQHFHLAEEDEQITLFYSQVIGDFVDDEVLGLFQPDQVAFCFGTFDTDKAHSEILFQVCPTKVAGAFIL